jgi:NADH-quinone oxidoreductase subunit M
MTDHLLSLLTFFPLVGMVLLLFFPRDNEGLLKGFTLVVTLITFFLSLPLAFNEVFKTSADMQYTEFAKWISIGDYFQMN